MTKGKTMYLIEVRDDEQSNWIPFMGGYEEKCEATYFAKNLKPVYGKTNVRVVKN